MSFFCFSGFSEKWIVMTTKKSFERNLKNDLNFSRQPTVEERARDDGDIWFFWHDYDSHFDLLHLWLTTIFGSGKVHEPHSSLNLICWLHWSGNLKSKCFRLHNHNYLVTGNKAHCTWRTGSNAPSFVCNYNVTTITANNKHSENIVYSDGNCAN